MGLAGHAEKCTEYLMGNHVMAERMFRSDPSVMLYAPLRTVIYTDRSSRTMFSVDRPSSVFSSFGNREVAAVGKELDAKLMGLLTVLEVNVGPAAPDEGKGP